MALPDADLRVDLAVDGIGRRASLVPGTPAGEAWVGRVVETPAYRALLTPADRNMRQVPDP
jgi:hypothetical protein